MSAPTPAPTQKPRKPFPAWRLIKGIKKATEGDLETSSESCERWAWTSGGLVVAGIAGEFVLAAIHPAYDSFWGQWGSAFADLLVGIGVAGEVLFSWLGYARQGELTRRYKEKLVRVEFDGLYLRSKVLVAETQLEQA